MTTFAATKRTHTYRFDDLMGQPGWWLEGLIRSRELSVGQCVRCLSAIEHWMYKSGLTGYLDLIAEGLRDDNPVIREQCGEIALTGLDCPEIKDRCAKMIEAALVAMGGQDPLFDEWATALSEATRVDTSMVTPEMMAAFDKERKG